MDYKAISTIAFAAFLLLVISIAPVSAVAGPPLICHRFDIADGKSLSWPSNSWNLSGSESYNGTNLTEDTIAILDSDPVVLVHMETLRRATLYGRKDPAAARELLTRLMARAGVAAATPPKMHSGLSMWVILSNATRHGSEKTNTIPHKMLTAPLL